MRSISLSPNRRLKFSARCAALRNLFELETSHGQEMAAYSKLLKQTVAATVAQFARKNAANLSTGRGSKSMDASHTVESNGDSVRGSSLKI